jgi:ribose transport system ATP-binding protein
MAAQGLAVLVVSSDLRELMGLCDRMLVMSRGVITGELPRDRFDEETILAMAYQEYTRAAHRETENVNATA